LEALGKLVSATKQEFQKADCQLAASLTKKS
jgi:hypothetical protein